VKETEAKKLKVGDRVEYRCDPPTEDDGSQGVVTDRDYSRFMVKWDDGTSCSYPHILAMAIHRVINKQKGESK
jgi:hypothetical protein